MRDSIFMKAYTEIIKPELINFDFMSETMGLNYMVKDYPVRIYAKAGVRYIQCGCLGTIMRPAALCKHCVAVIFREVLRLNPRLVLIDLDDPSFKIRTALEIQERMEED